MYVSFENKYGKGEKEKKKETKIGKTESMS
jgi:hypothetical protein